MQLLLVAALLGASLADIFMTNPKGSNNRLNEITNNRINAARLFDSQNNNKGGYNVAERGAATAGEDPTQQYQTQYYESGPGAGDHSRLVVEWANQHGCGSNPKVQCNVVIQYMCMNNGTGADYPAGEGATSEDNKERASYMRDGTNTQTQTYIQGGGRLDSDDEVYLDRLEQNYAAITADKGLHESFLNYDMCRHRESNAGLFHADQKINNDRLLIVGKYRKMYPSAKRTRQNPGGARRGFECPEERDYFPYWAPTLQGPYDPDYQRTPWIDAAYLGAKRKCGEINRNSFNTNGKYRCVLNRARDYTASITEEGCTAEGGTWVLFESYLEVLENVQTPEKCEEVAGRNAVNSVVWKPLRSDSQVNKCIVQAPAPVCTKAPTTRANHLGNAEGKPLYSSRFNLNLPHFPSGEAKRCVIRTRYNITTADYDAASTFADANGDASPVKNDPTVDVFGDGEGLTLAINTAQFGRTFQDRSHVFQVLPRTPEMAGKKLHNLNVRGQRGNIVQNYPSVEYDFVPDRLEVEQEDLVHVQWAGYNTNVPNRAGEGTDQTDRNNFVQMAGDMDTSYPELLGAADFWNSVESLTDPEAAPLDIAVSLASAGYYCGQAAHGTCPAGDSLQGNNRDVLQGQLNNAPASYFGHVLKMKGAGTYNYMCTRNNNFTNRSQKGYLVVKAPETEAEM